MSSSSRILVRSSGPCVLNLNPGSAGRIVDETSGGFAVLGFVTMTNRVLK